MSEAISEVEQVTEKIKQGRARKVNADNFYLFCEYPLRKEEKFGAFDWAKDYKEGLVIVEQVKLFLLAAPNERTSKSYVDKATYKAKAKINELKRVIELEHYTPFYFNKEVCEKGIADAQRRLSELNYVVLTDVMLHELHELIVRLNDRSYQAMTSWVKQKRFRDKKTTHQVTLSNRGKRALESLKLKLNTKDFNATLCELDKLY